MLNILNGFVILSHFSGSYASAVELRSYHITCDSAEYAYMISNPTEDIEIGCVFEYNGIIWDSAQIKIRGESSVEYPKKSYSIDFPPDSFFYNRKRINLISEWLDPSFVHEFLSYDLYNRVGLQASLCWFAKFYVNGVYKGLYLDVENVDKCFLERTDYTDNSSIFKASVSGSLMTAQENVEALWEKKTNESTGFYDLNNLILQINNLEEDNFIGQIEEFFDVEELATVIAVNSLIGNQSTYYHNYFLIHSLDKNGKWNYVPWDMDRTFIYWNNFAGPDYFRSGHQMQTGTNPLITKCWLDDDFRVIIFDKIEWIADNLFTFDYYHLMTDSLETLLYDAVQEDSLKQFSIEDFTSELDTIPYLVQNRNATIFSLMDNNPLPFNVNPTVLTPNGVYFSWTEAITNFPATISYKLQIADNYQFTQNLITINNITDNNITFSNLTSGLKHWRVYAKTETGNQTRCIAFFKTFDIPDSAFSGTEFSGIIDSSTIFTLEGSPYSFPEGLTVAEGCTLAVEAGVLMGIGANRSLRVEGILNILGTVDDSIRIIPLSMNEPWGMIVVAESAEVNISFANIFKGGIDSSGGICDLIQTDSGGVVNLSDCWLSEGDGRALYALKGSVSIERCEITDFALGAMLISGGSAKVIDCFIDRCCLNTDSCDIIFIEEIIDSMEIRGNNIYKGGDDAISLRNVQGGVIDGNFISGANDKGINLHNSSMGTNIFNNIVERCDEGIAIQDDSYATIFNNVLVLNDEGLSFKDFDNDAGAFVRNCVIWENDIDIMNGEWVNLDIGYCSIGENNPFPGTGNIYDDPKFIDPWNSYYYPEAESPLIDAGYGTDYPIFDLLDSIRVDILDVYNTGAGQVNYVDIGVYEYYSQDGFIIPPYLLPNTFGLGNYPNPFNTSTRIRFYLDNPGKAELKIFNVLGGLILEEEFQAQTPGWVIYNWEAKKGERDLSSGIYFCWLRFGHGTNAIKMVLIK